MAAGRRRFSTTVSLVSLLLLLVSPAAPFAAQPNLLLVGFGDSLTQGTMDATNNALNTRHAYLQKIADSLAQVSTLTFSQPLFDVAEKRMQPFQIPTNVGVDGADSFSVEGIQYYQRAGVPTSFVTNAYLADALLPLGFQDKYDEVLYPINLKLQKPTSMVDSTVWLLNQSAGRSQPVVIFWIGNNDSSAAALGEGGSNPSFLPIPFEQAAPTPGRRAAGPSRRTRRPASTGTCPRSPTSSPSTPTCCRA
ncbi:MAG: hypothetical protein HYR86_14990 [Candidatus Rokubacteria bacterium]|nr:hypothetical protein [Candidatus Rokubacteria bacterium]